jgi:DNA helicase HerA-like ATPase
MNGKSTINLEKEMNTKGRIIIFRISKNKMFDTYKYYTRFILGFIQMIALKRADLKETDRVHTHLFIDEFHNFITPSIEEILTESRKYKLFLTLAHQLVSQISSPKLRDIILSNTNVKIIGNNSNKTLEAMNKTLNEKLVDVENLEIGEFYIKAGNNSLIKVKNSDEYIGDKNSLSEDEWNESKEYQLNHYYRDIKVTNEAEEIDRKVDEFIAAILSKNLSYFEKIKERNETLHEELIYNFNDENGFIAQPLLSKYFNIINDNNHFSENKVFLQKLKEKNEFFNQNLDKNKTYNSKKRYSLQ